MGITFILITILLHFDISYAGIYNLNATEYDKLPPIYDVAPYESCLEANHGLYCTVQFTLVSDGYNPTMEFIKDYSAHTATHFNHTKLRYGLCVSRSCRTNNSTRLNLHQTIESCLNDTFYELYGLKTKLMNEDCVTSETLIKPKIEYEYIDVVMFVVLFLIIIMNVVGTYYEVQFASEKKNDSIWERTCFYFSIRRNWNKLRAPANGPDPRINRLKGIGGLRAISTMMVIGSHTYIAAVIFIANPRFVESLYKDVGTQILFNGSLLVQLFFIASGLLMTYNLLVESEKRKISWRVFPKRFIKRWFRLTPPYALLLLFTVSWMRFLGNGPAKHVAITDEVNDCRKYWWTHLLYINNHIDDSTCFPHAWYLAADTQLYCLGLIVFLICMSPSRRKIVLSLLLIAGVVIPALVNYLYDLDGLVIFSPETVGGFFIVDPTFNHVYKRGYTNMFNYVVGLGLGYMIYHGQQKNFNLDKYKKYRFIFWAIIPLCIGVVLIGSILYWEGPRQSIVIRTLLAAFVKPLFGLGVGAAFFGMIFKFENIYRSVFEWSLWTSLARLTYSAYVVHITLLRITLSTLTANNHVNFNYMAQQVVYLIMVSFLFAVPLHLMVEQPFRQLVNVFTSRPKQTDGNKQPNGNTIGEQKIEADVTIVK